MPKVFFMSYARPRPEKGAVPGDAEEAQLLLVDQFYNELSAYIRGKLINDEQAVSFRDSRSIEAGTAEWSTELHQQLGAFPVGLVLLSPAYLEQGRPWCRWECKHLESMNDYAQQHPPPGGEQPARLLLILNWVTPDERDVPPGFPSQVLRVGESIAAAKEGDLEAVRYVVGLGFKAVQELANAGDQEAKRLRTRFIQLLGDYIEKQWRRWQDVDEPARKGAPQPLAFDDKLPWVSPRPSNAATPAAPRKARTRVVYVVYVAAGPHEVPASRMHRYEDRGESDWRPFAGHTPAEDDRQADEFFNNAIPGSKVEKWPFSSLKGSMRDLLRQANLSAPILFVVDPWTATQLQEYRQILELYAQERQGQSIFCTPIVVWNNADPEGMAQRAEFERLVKSTFAPEPWDSVVDADELREAAVTASAKLYRGIRDARSVALPNTDNPPPRISPT